MSYKGTSIKDMVTWEGRGARKRQTVDKEKGGFDSSGCPHS